MKSDAEIAAECADITYHLGPTKAAWYKEACEIGHDAVDDILLWACSFREAVRDAVNLSSRLQKSDEQHESFLIDCNRSEVT